MKTLEFTDAELEEFRKIFNWVIPYRLNDYYMKRSNEEKKTILGQVNTYLKSSEKKIRDYLSDISESAKEKISKFACIKKTDVIDFLVKNAIALKANNSPILNAPKRGEMPQTSKDLDLFSDLKKGTTKVA